MAKIITEDELREAIKNTTLLSDGDVNCAEGIKYDFRLGTKFLKAYFGCAVDYKDLSSPEDIRRAVVEPGEVVFVLSRERIKLPRDMFIQLNPKRSLSQDGIELLGGLTVDPGYEGRLVFGLRNIAGKPYQLRPDTKIVGAHFFRLSDDEIVNSSDNPDAIDDFPQRLQDLIEKYEPVNPQNLAEELRKLKNSFEEKQIQMSEDVALLKQQINVFTKELEKEAIKRESETQQLSEKLQSVSGKLDSLSQDNAKNEVQLGFVQKTLDEIKEQTSVLKNGAAINAGEKKVIGHLGTAIVTFVLTVIAGVIVYYITNIVH